jgi:RimJ/RimL family protein N-acetyltransferase
VTDGQASGPPAGPLLVEGELVALGPLRREHIELYLSWMNDLRITSWLGRPDVFPREAEERFYDGATADDQTYFTIYERATARPIGTTSLKAVNYRYGTAEFGILIGEPDCWNRGYGTETTRLVLDYAFHVLGLHNVLLGVFANNPRGRRAYEKAGFKLIGLRREAYKVGQHRYDVVQMDALASDFVSPVLEARLTAPQER